MYDSGLKIKNISSYYLSSNSSYNNHLNYCNILILKYNYLCKYIELNYKLNNLFWPQWQKPFLIKKYLINKYYKKYKWFLFIDNDILFMNCSINIYNIIKYTYKNYNNNKNISFIISGDGKGIKKKK